MFHDGFRVLLRRLLSAVEKASSLASLSPSTLRIKWADWAGRPLN